MNALSAKLNWGMSSQVLTVRNQLVQLMNILMKSCICALLATIPAKLALVEDLKSVCRVTARENLTKQHANYVKNSMDFKPHRISMELIAKKFVEI